MGLEKRAFIMASVKLVVLALLIFGGAGRIAWWEGWVFLGLNGIVTILLIFALLRHDPELLAERLKMGKRPGQPFWDKAFGALFAILMFSVILGSAMDAGRYHFTTVGPLFQIAGLMFLCLGARIQHLAFLANSYMSPVVCIQAERGQQVIKTGPYAYVRHPLYTAVCLQTLGVAWLLGSWIGFGIAWLVVLLLAWRAVKEEAVLVQELDGYTEYLEETRYRLLPNVW